MIIVFNMPEAGNHPPEEAHYWGALRGAAVCRDVQLSFVIPDPSDALRKLGIYGLVNSIVVEFIMQLDRSN